MEENTKNNDLIFGVYAHGISDRAPGMIAIYNINTGIFVYVNKSIKKILGFEPEDFINGGVEFVSGLVHPDDFSGMMKQNEEALARANIPSADLADSDPIAVFEYRMKHKNGTYRWLRTDGSVFDRDEQGRVRHVMNISVDITAQKEAERIKFASEQIQQSKEELEAIFNNVADGITVQDHKGYLMFANEAAIKFLGCNSLEEILITPAIEISNRFEMSDEHGNPMLASNLPGRKALKGETGEEILIKWKNKLTDQEGWSAVKASPVFDKDRNVKFAVNVWRNVTEQKSVQKEYEKINRRNQHILESITDGFFALDNDWKFTYINKQAEGFFQGKTRDELINKNIFEMFPIAKETETFKQLGDALLKKEPLRYEEYFPQTSQWIESSVYPTKDGLAVYLRDVTAQKHSADTLRKSEERFRSLIEHSTDGVAMLDVDAKITYASQTINKILGYTVDEFVGRNGFELMHPDDVNRVMGVFTDLISKNPGEMVAVEYRYLHKKGHWVWLEAHGNNLLTDELVGGVVVNYRDITDRKLAEQKLHHQIYHDHLTDLPNRTYLKEKFAECLYNAANEKNSVGLMLIDLDRFKTINESLGHSVGDRMIQEVALRFRSCIKENHILSRLGGDEFGILIPDVKEEKEVAELALKILEDFRTPFYLESHELYISPSIGISLYPYDGTEPATLFKNAEVALYLAKDHGRNTYQFYTTTMNASSYEKLTMESKLRHAIENDEFVLHYQPQIEVSSGKILGAEELIRWKRPDSGLVLPDRFIPLIEANGLIEPIGAWVLKESLRQAKIWHDMGFKMIMAINLSARQFKQKNFENIVLNIIEESGLDPSYIELELTESVLAENPQSVMNIMNALRERGVKFCLDDFSTGYSSLRYIKQFPVDMLKIERSFLKDIPTDLQNCAIAKSIITLGKSLNLEITAEGVETKKQLAFLRENSCHRAQGFLFNGAMPAAALSEILGEDRYASVVNSLEKPKASPNLFEN